MTRRIRIASMVAALGLAISVGVWGQSWRGAATLEMEVLDGKTPVPGAQVILQFAEIEPKQGPPSAMTDARGHLVVSGLAEGRWLVEIRKEGLASYLALLRLEVGKKVEMVAGPIRDGAAPPMKVRFEKVGMSQRPQVAEGRDRGRDRRPAVPPPPAPPPEEAGEVLAGPGVVGARPAPMPPPAPAPAPPAPTPPSPTVPTPTVTAPPPAVAPAEPEPEPEPALAAPAPEPATVAPEPVPEPVLEPEPPSEPAVQVAPPPAVVPSPAPSPAPPPAPQPESPAVAAPPAPAPPPADQTLPPPEPVAVEEAAVEEVTSEVMEEAPAAPAPTPEAPKPTPAEPVAPSAPPPSAAPEWARVKAELRAYDRGNCGDCKPGEWGLTTEQVAARGGQALGSAQVCPEGAEEAATSAMKLIAGAGLAGVAGAAGPLLEPITGEVTAMVPASVRSEVAQLLNGVRGAAASCQLVAVLLPKGARFTGYRYEVYDPSGGGDCLAGEECRPVTRAGWLGHPQIQRTPDGTLIYSFFTNWSFDQERVARMTVYFNPPRK